jgi:hypothetical protein
MQLAAPGAPLLIWGGVLRTLWAVFGGRGRMYGMSPSKEQLIRVIQDQPDDSSPEEILRELAFATMVERGLADADAGRTISNEEMARRIESWRK